MELTEQKKRVVREQKAGFASLRRLEVEDGREAIVGYRNSRCVSGHTFIEDLT
jgi:hypothetical protein